MAIGHHRPTPRKMTNTHLSHLLHRSVSELLLNDHVLIYILRHNSSSSCQRLQGWAWHLAAIPVPLGVVSYGPLGFSFTSIKSKKSLTVRGLVGQMEFSIFVQWIQQYNGRELCFLISAVTAQKVSARSQNVMEKGNNARH